jgi:hypothetical protein
MGKIGQQAESPGFSWVEGGFVSPARFATSGAAVNIHVLFW